jgi:hypothetical protein
MQQSRYDYLHVAIDDRTRLAYVEALPDERDLTCAGFLYRAVTWFREQGVTVLRVLTDNAQVYRRGRNWRAVCVALGLRRRFTKLGCPWTNGKAERFNRTLLAVAAGSLLSVGLGGRPPVSRLAGCELRPLRFVLVCRGSRRREGLRVCARVESTARAAATVSWALSEEDDDGGHVRGAGVCRLCRGVLRS